MKMALSMSLKTANNLLHMVILPFYLKNIAGTLDKLFEKLLDEFFSETDYSGKRDIILCLRC